MNLTVPQLQAVKTWVNANASGIFEQSTVDLLNAVASPDYYIFKDIIKTSEIMSNGWDWTMVDNANVGPARIWEWMMRLSQEVGGISPWKVTILQGVGEAWKGNTPAGKDVHRRNILRNHFCRKCTVFEKLFVTAIAEWNVGSNNDRTGARGAQTNPDIMPLDAVGKYLIGPIDIDTLITAAGS